MGYRDWALGACHEQRKCAIRRSAFLRSRQPRSFHRTARQAHLLDALGAGARCIQSIPRKLDSIGYASVLRAHFHCRSSVTWPRTTGSHVLHCCQREEPPPKNTEVIIDKFEYLP